MSTIIDATDNLENTSGQGRGSAVPAELLTWSWAAFLMNWVWGLANGVYMSLLVFVPVVGIFIPFILGYHGNQWAWQNSHWDSVDAFRRRQRAWAFVGLIPWVLMVAALVGLLYFFFSGFKSTDSYHLSVQALQSDEDLIRDMGSPLEINGYSFNFSGDTTVIDLEISGPKGRRSARVFLKDVNGKTEVIRTIIGDDLRPLDQSPQYRTQKPYIST